MNETCHVATTTFRDQIGDAEYPFESERYWLFTSKLCPFAHRTELARQLTGMVEHIGLTVAGSVLSEKGWNLGQPYAASAISPVAGIDRLSGIYELSSPGYSGRASVPVLFDRKTQTIVNNESAEIIKMIDELAVELTDHQTLYPKSSRDQVDEVIRLLNDEFISPIYRAGFAKTQASYEANYNIVFSALDELEQRFASVGPFITGDKLTLADVHAFPHLSRFDAIYHALYRLDRNFMNELPGISAYLKRLGAIPAFADTLDLQASKEGYFLSWNQPTHANFVPAGPVVDPRSGVAVAAATAA